MNIYFHSPYLRVQQLGHMLDIEVTLVETVQQFCIVALALKLRLVKFCAVYALAVSSIKTFPYTVCSLACV